MFCAVFGTAKGASSRRVMLKERERCQSARLQRSLGAEGSGGIGEGGAAGGNEARDGGRGGKSENGNEQDGWVHVFDFVELRFHKANAEERGGNADCEAEERLTEGAAHDHSDDTGGASAERHANADLGGAASDSVGGEAIKADGGEEKSENAKESR